MVMPSFSEIFTVLKKTATVEDQQKLIELQEATFGLREEKLRLEQENQQLREELDLRKSVKFEKPFYWHVKDDGSQDGPFCPGCYDQHGKLIRMHEGRNGYMQCTSCKFGCAGPDHARPVAKTKGTTHMSS
jgi:hypothetical protein